MILKVTFSRKVWSSLTAGSRPDTYVLPQGYVLLAPAVVFSEALQLPVEELHRSSTRAGNILIS